MTSLLDTDGRTTAGLFLPRRRSMALPSCIPLRATSLGRLLLLSDGLAGLMALAVSPSYSLLALPVVALTALSLADSELYRPRLRMSMLDDAPQVWLRGLAAATVFGGPMLLLGETASGSALLYAGIAFVLLALLGRSVTYAAVSRQRRSGHQARGLVIGTGAVGQRLVQALSDAPQRGVRPVAFLDGTADVGHQLAGLPVRALDPAALGDAVASAVREWSADVVLVTPTVLEDDQVVEALRGCDRIACEVFVVPRFHDLGTWRCHTEEVGGLPLLRLRRAAHRSLAWGVKRAFDVVASAAALLALAPVIALCAFGARVDGGRGVLFRQTRVGLDGQPFSIFKIRSLRPLDETDSATTWSVSGSARLSTFGRLLRRSSLDELPQLWNVLRGDMSLVGPRPERPRLRRPLQRGAAALREPQQGPRRSHRLGPGQRPEWGHLHR